MSSTNDFFSLRESEKVQTHPDYSWFFHSKQFKERLNTLNRIEKQIWNQMSSRSGVLKLKGAPGSSKSAVIKSICRKLGMAFFDLRISQKDETDLQMPDKVRLDDITVVDYAVPRWAINANKYPSVVFFDEFNRGTKQVMNASMQLLLDMEIGEYFRFASHVFMVAACNEGDGDQTDVNELDSAQNNRMISKDYVMPFDVWVTDFAEKTHFQLFLLSFLKLHPHLANDKLESGSNIETFSTFRSWTNLSEYLVTTYGGGYMPDDNGKPIMCEINKEPKWFKHGYLFNDASGTFITSETMVTMYDKKAPNGVFYVCNLGNDINEIYKECMEVAYEYIGTNAVELIKYLRQQTMYSHLDIINKYSDLAKNIDKMPYDFHLQMSTTLCEYNFKNITGRTQVVNVTKYIHTNFTEEMVIAFYSKKFSNIRKKVDGSQQEFESNGFKAIFKVLAEYGYSELAKDMNAKSNTNS